MEQSKYLTPSIDSQADYSDGQSLIPYTQQWDLRSSRGTEAEYSVYFEVNLGTAPQVTISVAGPYESVIARLLGYIMVSVLPEQGLSEALQCLNDTWKFYTEESSHIPSLPSLPRKVRPRVAGRDKRPGLVFSK